MMRRAVGAGARSGAPRPGHAGYVLWGLRGAKAILVYVALKPRDTTFLYKTFARAVTQSPGTI